MAKATKGKQAKSRVLRMNGHTPNNKVWSEYQRRVRKAEQAFRSFDRKLHAISNYLDQQSHRASGALQYAGLDEYGTQKRDRSPLPVEISTVGNLNSVIEVVCDAARWDLEGSRWGDVESSIRHIFEDAVLR